MFKNGLRHGNLKESNIIIIEEQIYFTDPTESATLDETIDIASLGRLAL